MLKKGFTLVEVLTALAILGVISAILMAEIVVLVNFVSENNQL